MNSHTLLAKIMNKPLIEECTHNLIEFFDNKGTPHRGSFTYCPEAFKIGDGADSYVPQTVEDTLNGHTCAKQLMNNAPSDTLDFSCKIVSYTDDESTEVAAIVPESKYNTMGQGCQYPIIIDPSTNNCFNTTINKAYQIKQEEQLKLNQSIQSNFIWMAGSLALVGGMIYGLFKCSKNRKQQEPKSHSASVSTARLLDESTSDLEAGSSAARLTISGK